MPGANSPAPNLPPRCSWHQRGRRAVGATLATLFPANCFGCDQPLGPRSLLGACLGCWDDLEWIGAEACKACGLPHPLGTDLLRLSGVCWRCQDLRAARGSELTAGIRGVVIYDTQARRFLLRAKRGHHGELFGPMGRQLAAAVRSEGWVRQCDAVVPVPSHPLVTLRRGFAPAAELSRVVSRHLGLRHAPRTLGHKLIPDAAPRSRSAAQRWGRQSRFFLRSKPGCPCVLLVDDVMTTGATVAGCVAALQTGGVAEVRVAVWGRTPIDRLPRRR